MCIRDSSISILYFDIGKGEDYLYHGQNHFIGVHTGDRLEVTTKEKDAIVHKIPAEIFPEYFLIRLNEFNQVATTPLEEWLDYLKNDPILKTETKVLALQVVEANAVKQGDYLYSRALISVTDRLFKPDWWLVNDAGTEENPGNSVDWFYLGEYSEKKYQMFLDELKKDDMVFDGKNKQVLRKYSLRLKNTLKQMNEGKNKEDWVKDEHGNVITVEVAG